MDNQTTIADIYHFYKAQIENHLQPLKRLKRRIYHIGTLRLLLFTGMLVVLWVFRDKDLSILIAVSFVCLLAFLLLVVYHSRLYKKQAFNEGLIRLFENELKALDYDFSAYDGAPEHIDAMHAFSMDLDIFGERSLFQSINRTVTSFGKETLINRFKRPFSDKNEILLQQESIREMKELTTFRHHFYVTGTNAKAVLKNLLTTDNPSCLSSNRFVKIIIWLVPAVWSLLTTLSILQIIPVSGLFGYFAVSFFITNLPFKSIQKVLSSVSKTEKNLLTYSKLMALVEHTPFNTTLLKTFRSKLTESSASLAIKQLSRTIGALDQRFSLIGIFLNLFYMRDARQAMKLERWQRKYSAHLSVWFDALGVIDAFCSFGAFAFNHPDYTYPTLAQTYFEMKGKALGHPLINRDICVRNDITIPKSKFFLIVTGANMAGKSTFLRTVGVNFLFAGMGLPVCAESLTVYPAGLFTSLRTADSLIANESYFFAELKRLKMIIDRLDADEELLIILDEILKGTNSVDKQKGSLALIQQLINKNTCGIIATHDLLLGSLAETFPEHVVNKRFEADIQGDELSFTYQLREGLAQNMNATFLMKKMGIF